MTDKLAEICAAKRAHVAEQKARRSLADLDRAARAMPPPRGFMAALQRRAEQGRPGLICEIKRASPSAGAVRADLDPATIAQAYETGGAACLSVLTDAPYFQGANDDVIAARAACSLPVLRKDFILDPWQVAEARAIGADCILLIMAALDDAEADELHAAALDYGLDVLIESHNEEELFRALRLPSGMIGINNRNLKTLTTDLATTETLAPRVPPGRIIVGESGLKTAADLARLRAVGVSCFLIGESLLKQRDIAAATAAMLS